MKNITLILKKIQNRILVEHTDKTFDKYFIDYLDPKYYN